MSLCLVFLRLRWFGLVEFGLVWLSLVWFGQGLCDLVEFDSVLSINRQTNKLNNYLILINLICEFVS